MTARSRSSPSAARWSSRRRPASPTAAPKPMRLDSVFPVFSISKAFNADSGAAASRARQTTLNTFVSRDHSGVRGERQAAGHDRQSALSQRWPARELPGGARRKDRRLDAVMAAVCDVGLEAVPGEEVSYSPIMAHAILGQVVRQLDGESGGSATLPARNCWSRSAWRTPRSGLERKRSPRGRSCRACQTRAPACSTLPLSSASVSDDPEPRPRTSKFQPAVLSPQAPISSGSPRPCGSAARGTASALFRRP